MKQFTYNKISIQYRESSCDEEVIQHSFDNDIFFRGIPEYKPGLNDIIIDVGAHIGTFAILSAIKSPHGKVFAFEACDETYNILKNNVDCNNLENIRPLHVALSDSDGETKLYYDIEHGNWGHSIVKAFSESGEKVNSISLNTFFADNKIAKVNLIKFNCEGAEFRILLNTSITNLKKIENYVILYHMDLESDYHVNDLEQLFRNLGFYVSFRDVSKDKKRGWMIVVNRGRFYKYYFTCTLALRWCINMARRVIRKIVSH